MKTEPNDPISPMIEQHRQLGIIGLTKREYFAALALQGFVANTSCNAERTIMRGQAETYANDAVTLADALINSLNKTT